MIPLARMMKYGNVVSTGILLDIDFSTHELGSTAVIDSGQYEFPFTKLNALSAVIEYDATLDSKVMHFNGGVFSTPVVQELMLSSRNFEIDVMYRSTSTDIQVLYGTGYYPDVTNRQAGMCHQIGQYVGNDQYFIDNGNTFQRNLLDQSNTSVWQRLVYTRMDSTVTISRYRDSVLVNSSSNYPDLDFGNGTFFGIGGYYRTPGTYSFIGYMQYLKIKLL